MKQETTQHHEFASREAFRIALDKTPPSGWVKKRSLGGAKSSTYIPIEVLQATADRFFDEIDVIKEHYQQIENEILCTVTMQLLPSYPNADYRIVTGTGATPIQAKSGSLIEKFPRGKLTNSLEYCAPKARTSAISNALSTMGNVFGRNLGRAVSAGFKFAKEEKSKKKKSKKKKNGKK